MAAASFDLIPPELVGHIFSFVPGLAFLLREVCGRWRAVVDGAQGAAAPLRGRDFLGSPGALAWACDRCPAAVLCAAARAGDLAALGLALPLVAARERAEALVLGGPRVGAEARRRAFEAAAGAGQLEAAELLYCYWYPPEGLLEAAVIAGRPEAVERLWGGTPEHRQPAALAAMERACAVADRLELYLHLPSAWTPRDANGVFALIRLAAAFGSERMVAHLAGVAAAGPGGPHAHVRVSLPGREGVRLETFMPVEVASTVQALYGHAKGGRLEDFKARLDLLCAMVGVIFPCLICAGLCDTAAARFERPLRPGGHDPADAKQALEITRIEGAGRGHLDLICHVFGWLETQRALAAAELERAGPDDAELAARTLAAIDGVLGGGMASCRSAAVALAARAGRLDILRRLALAPTETGRACVIAAACGQAAVVKWALKHAESGGAPLSGFVGQAFRAAAEGGHLAIAILLYGGERPPSVRKAAIVALGSDRARVVGWLYSLNPAQVVRTFGEMAAVATPARIVKMLETFEGQGLLTEENPLIIAEVVRLLQARPGDTDLCAWIRRKVFGCAALQDPGPFGSLYFDKDSAQGAALDPAAEEQRYYEFA